MCVCVVRGLVRPCGLLSICLFLPCFTFKLALCSSSGSVQETVHVPSLQFLRRGLAEDLQRTFGGLKGRQTPHPAPHHPVPTLLPSALYELVLQSALPFGPCPAVILKPLAIDSNHYIPGAPEHIFSFAVQEPSC